MCQACRRGVVSRKEFGKGWTTGVTRGTWFTKLFFFVAEKPIVFGDVTFVFPCVLQMPLVDTLRTRDLRSWFSASTPGALVAEGRFLCNRNPRKATRMRYSLFGSILIYFTPIHAVESLMLWISRSYVTCNLQVCFPPGCHQHCSGGDGGVTEELAGRIHNTRYPTTF